MGFKEQQNSLNSLQRRKEEVYLFVKNLSTKESRKVTLNLLQTANDHTEASEEEQDEDLMLHMRMTVVNLIMTQIQMKVVSFSSYQEQ